MIGKAGERGGRWWCFGPGPGRVSEPRRLGDVQEVEGPHFVALWRERHPSSLSLKLGSLQEHMHTHRLTGHIESTDTHTVNAQTQIHTDPPNPFHIDAHTHTHNPIVPATLELAL